MNWETQFAKNSKALFKKAGKQVSIYGEGFEAATSNTSAGGAVPTLLWTGFARIESYSPSRAERDQIAPGGEIPDWVAILPVEAVSKLPDKAEWWLMWGGKRLYPTRPYVVDGASGGVAELGLKESRQ